MKRVSFLRLSKSLVTVITLVTLGILSLIGCARDTHSPVEARDFRKVVQSAKGKVFPAVVYIRCLTVSLAGGEKKTHQVSGSGVILTPGGEVITNHHVVDRADEISVTLADGRTLVAKTIGVDPQVDLAVLQVDPKALALGDAQIEFSDSQALRVGDFVVAIGNPFGLSQTVTSGIVSALGRTGLGIEGYEDLIQTDASINPGNSGGALVDLRGRLVGLNTAIYSPSGGNVGIGFAIPANMVLAIMEQLIKHPLTDIGLEKFLADWRKMD